MPYLDGIASGLNTTALIDAIVYAQSQPLVVMRQDLEDAEDVKEAIAGLTSRFNDITTSLEDIDTADEFTAFSTSLSSEDQFSATAGEGASPGTYNITVSSLAFSETEVSQGYADKSTLGTLGTGDVNITVGGVASTVTLDGTNNSLEGLAEALNELDGVTSYVLDTGDATDPYKLVVQGDDTGAANTIEIDTSALAGGTNPTFTETRSASDAQLDVNGITVNSASNTVTALPGLTIDLTNTGTDPVTLTVSEDEVAIADKIEAFVDAFNEAVGYYNKETAYNPDLGITGGLVGESSARRAVDGIGTVVSSPYEVGGAYSILAEVGITTSQDGTLELDRTTLEDALLENSEDVQKLFTDPNGPGVALSGRINDLYVDEETGSLTSRSESVEGEIEDLQTRIEDMEEYLDDYTERLRSQFVAMEQAMSSLNASAGMIGAMFASMPAPATPT